MLTTFVESEFNAKHLGPFATNFHGHKWFVRAHFAQSGTATVNAETLQKGVDEILEKTFGTVPLDTVIGQRNATNEGVAQAVFGLLDGRFGKCVKVETWRVEKGRRFGACAE